MKAMACPWSRPCPKAAPPSSPMPARCRMSRRARPRSSRAGTARRCSRSSTGSIATRTTMPRSRRRAAASGRRPGARREISVALALEDIATGASHDFAAPVRQLVYLSIHPEILDLSLASVRANLPFIDRVVVLTSPMPRTRSKRWPGGIFPRRHPHRRRRRRRELPADHQARNTWLRKKLYRHDAIEAELPRRRRGCHRAPPARTAPTFKSLTCIAAIISWRTWRIGSRVRRRPRASTVACAMSGACWRKPPTRREPSPVTCRRSSTRAWQGDLRPLRARRRPCRPR